MPTHSPTPAYAQWALARPHRLRPLVCLLRVGLLVVIGLCALTHGPAEEETHRSAPAATTSVTPTASDAESHGPHRHHESEECDADGVVRTTAPAAEQPPAGAAILALAGASAVVMRPPARRQPNGRRRTRTGRIALVRTSRWRI